MVQARRIALIGPMAVGKSVVGRLVAQRAELAFVDTDRLITERHGSISDIFETEGEQAFRRLEAGVVREALATDNTVVSLGGGAVLHPGTRDLLRSVTVVFLDTDLDSVRPRISGDTGRPLLAGGAEARWQALFDERRPLYESLAHITIDTRGRAARAVADAVLAAEHARRQPSRMTSRSAATDQKSPTDESVTAFHDH